MGMSRVETRSCARCKENQKDHYDYRPAPVVQSQQCHTRNSGLLGRGGANNATWRCPPPSRADSRADTQTPLTEHARRRARRLGPPRGAAARPNVPSLGPVAGAVPRPGFFAIARARPRAGARERAPPHCTDKSQLGHRRSGRVSGAAAESCAARRATPMDAASLPRDGGRGRRRPQQGWVPEPGGGVAQVALCRMSILGARDAAKAGHVRTLGLCISRRFRPRARARTRRRGLSAL